ncbi:serine/threonine-protein kinase PLK4-like [Saccostrea cucullata]|uniref:serine/threonine-protein kinase PLK4-like n=1 Tax=Saccostrea cuccullata TaxID=36930 RepID=UPI002ED52CBD
MPFGSWLIQWISRPFRGFGDSKRKAYMDILNSLEDTDKVMFVENGHGKKGLLVFRQKIKKSGTSVIYAGASLMEPFPVVYKLVNKKYCDLLLKEYIIMRSVWHRNILHVRGIHFSLKGNVVIMRMDAAYNRDLYSYLRTTEGYVNKPVLDKWMKELVSAMCHVHSKGYVHGDLNYKNILLTKDLSIRVADFGSADKKSKFKLTRYDPKFLPPELNSRRLEPIPAEYDTRLIDVWGVGVVLFFALTKHHPFTESITMSATDVHGNCPGETLLYDEDRRRCSSSYAKVVGKLMDYNAARRPKLCYIIRQDYFSET